jgi:outer membrane protein assembly factor BamD
MRKLGILLAFVALGTGFFSCSNFRSVEKSPDWRVKYEAAIEYYENEDYFRSSTLFEQILPIVRGLPEGEKVQFYYAYAQYYQNLYDLAGHHFKTFYETYGRSEFAQEAYYMYAYSLYSTSPTYNLDQTNSLEALIAMQDYINRYPTSEFVDEAARVIDDIQRRLERKGYENAKQYYRMQNWNAAVIAFDSFANSFPDSGYNEEVLYLKFISQYQYAMQSISTKQIERFKEANEYYQEFVDSYPESSFLKDAEKTYAKSLEELTELNSYQ